MAHYTRSLKNTACHSDERSDEEPAFRNLLIYHVQQILRSAQNDSFSRLPSIFNKLLGLLEIDALIHR